VEDKGKEIRRVYIKSGILAGGVAHVEEHLPGKHKALSSKHHTVKKRKNK
jgi:hypothetical protein